MDEVKLLPCPHCGWQRLGADCFAEDEAENVWCVECPNCFARGPLADAPQTEAIAAWNTRAIEATRPTILTTDFER